MHKHTTHEKGSGVARAARKVLTNAPLSNYRRPEIALARLYSQERSLSSLLSLGGGRIARNIGPREGRGRSTLRQAGSKKKLGCTTDGPGICKAQCQKIRLSFIRGGEGSGKRAAKGAALAAA